MSLNEEQFWHYMTRSAINEYVGDYGTSTDHYEFTFDRVVPQRLQRTLRCYRAAALLTAVIDFSRVPATQIVADARSLSNWDSDFSSLLCRFVLEDIRKCELHARIRRAYVLGEVGDVNAIRFLSRMTVNSGELRTEAIRSMRRIADRIGLDGAPPDDAPSEDWVRWAKDRSPKSE